LHIEHGKYIFLHIDTGNIFTGLFKKQNVMIYILPRLLKKGQALKLCYCTLKKYSAIHFKAIAVKCSSMRGHSKEGFETC